MAKRKDVIPSRNIPSRWLNSCPHPSSLSFFTLSLSNSIIFSISDCLFGKRKRTTRWNFSKGYFQVSKSLKTWRDFVNVVSCGVREGVKAGYSKTNRHFVSPSQMHYLQCDVKENLLGYKPN